MALLWAGWTAMGSAAVEIFQLSFPHRSTQEEFADFVVHFEFNLPPGGNNGLAKEKKVVTQMGIQIHSSVYYRMAAQVIQDGAIGKIKDVHTWSIDGKVIYSFARTAMTEGESINVTWYDGASRPPQEIIALLEGKPLPDQGSIFIGTEGVLLLPHVSRLELFSKEKFKDYQLPRVTGADHWEQFIEACRGNGKTSADFSYAGPLTEAILLGGIASRFQNTTLKWNSKELKFDHAEATTPVCRAVIVR